MPQVDDRHRDRARHRALVKELHREALSEEGQRLQALQEQTEQGMGRLGYRVVAALQAGFSVSEVAKLSGVSRSKVYELRDLYGAQFDDLDMRALARLAAGGGMTVDGLAEQLERPVDQVSALVNQLLERQLVRVAITQYDGGNPEAWFRLTADGMRAVEDWILGGGQEAPRMTVYASLELTEMEAMRDAAIDVIGPEWFAVIEPGTTSDQTGPELGFHVGATTHEEAVQLATDRMRQLRKVAGLPEKTVRLTALGPTSNGYVRSRDVEDS